MPPDDKKGKLKIHPATFKPSHLSIPPSPFSPLSPLHFQTPQSQLNVPSTQYPPPSPSAQPPLPLQWHWQCHQCRRIYALGVTRRCLDDGHYFCAGMTTMRNWRKSKSRRKRVMRHRACPSEFDYYGWKYWGLWRRSGRQESLYRSEGDDGLSDSLSSCEEFSDSLSSCDEFSDSLSSCEEFSGPLSSCDEFSETLSPCDEKSEPEHIEMVSPFSTCDEKSGPEHIEMVSPLTPDGKAKEKETIKKKDCWNTCDYPSECIWGRQYGIHTPVISTLANASAADPQSPPPAYTSLEGILKPENVKNIKSIKKWEKEKEKEKEKEERKGFWDALIASATRRNSVTPSSPLARGPEAAGAQSVEDSASVDKDGDVIMTSEGEESQNVRASWAASIDISTSTSIVVSPAPSQVVSSKVHLDKETTKKKSKRSQSPRTMRTRTSNSFTHETNKAPVTGPGEDGLQDREMLVAELAPLERVKSRRSENVCIRDQMHAI